MVDVPLLVSPLDPPARLARGVDQDEAVHPLGVLEGVAEEDVAPQAHAQADELDHGKVVQNVVDLDKKKLFNIVR